MYVRIPYNTQHMHSADVLSMCIEREGKSEITNEAAVSIAAWYQGPRGFSSTFAALCSHREVRVSNLLEAIAAERMNAAACYAGVDAEIQPDLKDAYAEEMLTLDMLATWALNFGDNNG